MSPAFGGENKTGYIEPKKAAFMFNYRMLNLGFNTAQIYNIKIKTKRQDTVLSDI